MSKPRSAYTSNVRNDGLTPSQERAIRAMLTARSIAAAARQADVGQSTLRRWLREDENFQNKLRQFREQALSHAALMLQQGAARAVAIMYKLIQSGRPIEPGRVSLIRTAIEYAFRSAVYCDIIERVKALEKARRQNQPVAGNPRPPPTRSQPQNGAARVSKRFPLVRDQPVWETSTSQSPQPQKVDFPRPARSCSSPTVGHVTAGIFLRSAQTCARRSDVARAFLRAVVAISGDIGSTPYGEHTKQAQRNNGRPIASVSRQVVTNAGWPAARHTPCYLPCNRTPIPTETLCNELSFQGQANDQNASQNRRSIGGNVGAGLGLLRATV